MRSGAIVLLAAAAQLAAQGPQRLTRREAEEIALKNHPAIRSAEFGALAMAERPAQIASVRYPAVVGNLTGAGAPENSRLAAGGLNNPIIYSRFASGFTISQLLLDFGRTSRLLAASRSQSQAAGEFTKMTRADIVLEVDRSYLDALRAQAVLQVAEETLASRQLLLDQTTELQKAQIKSALDVSFAGVAVEEARLLIASARNQRDAAYARLANALGYSDVRSFELVDEPMRIEPLAASEQVQEALRNRPDLHARTLLAEAAGSYRAAERALRYPAVSAIASAGLIPGRDDALKSRYGALGVNVTLPFLNGGLYKAREGEAEMRAREAGEQVKELENRIGRDVRVALLGVNTAAERVGLTARLLDQASQALDLAQARYDLGLSSIVELSQAQLARTSAAIQSAEARYDYQIQRASLDRETGRTP
jgi:outer membrane protein